MAHIHTGAGEVDWTVEVYIVHAGRVLLRKHDKYGIWLGVGGHIELDETPAAAAPREVLEEVGLSVELIDAAVVHFPNSDTNAQLPMPMAMNVHAINDTHQHIGLVYAARATTTDIVPGPGEQQDGWQWYTTDELASSTELSADVRAYAIAALELVQ
jgi:8-oxo-dGTP diphosphatase